jgi:hypothetical protein
MDGDEEFAVAYSGVELGIPVLTRDGQQFGFLEHVLAVEEEDIFEGFVVWIGTGSWADRKIQHELSRGHTSAARHLEALRPHELRFVQADKVAAITVGYIRCDLDMSEVATLPPPSGTPVFHTSDFDRPQRRGGRYNNQVYGSAFGLAGWFLTPPRPDGLPPAPPPFIPNP